MCYAILVSKMQRPGSTSFFQSVLYIVKFACFSKHKSRFFETYIHPCRSHYLEDRVVISMSATAFDGNCLLAMICSIKFSTNELMV
jgi:hypothetical protein